MPQKKVRMFYESVAHQESQLVDVDTLTIAKVQGNPVVTQNVQTAVELWARKIAHSRGVEKYSFCWMFVHGAK